MESVCTFAVFRDILKSMMSAPYRQILSRRLGKNPFPRALGYWAFGIAFCFVALEVNKFNAVWGPIMMGLATFVNFFCFVQGMNHAKRAFARWCTLRTACRLGLSSETVYNAAGFIVIDAERGYIVCNGRTVDLRRVTKIVCKSNFMVHKLDIFVLSRTPISLGYADLAALFTAADSLCDAVQKLTGQRPEFVLDDERGGTTACRTDASR